MAKTKMKQYTIEVKAFVTVTAPEGLNPSDIPMKLDVFDSMEHDDSTVEELNETDIISRTIVTEVYL